MDIRARLASVQERIAQSARRAGRDPETVTLLGASKMVGPDRIMAAISLGIKDVGENQVQEAEVKIGSLPSLHTSATWHMIGHLQTNKVRRALDLFDVFQSIDSVRLAQILDRCAAELGRQVPVYVEVNVGLEPAKFGVSPDQMESVAQAVVSCQHLRLEGLMTVAPYLEDPEEVRPYFRKLRMLRDLLNGLRLFDYEVRGLSMGMTHDFEVAVEEGATLVRLGTAIWGARPG
ncbi:MAG: YggS family pyridoxal phosphate-dependent enzyme [Chloroflexi bacterium]|nr:YggS family pyridoxal phosphate-dependent enzyme [Chloroflexota bacterium]